MDKSRTKMPTLCANAGPLPEKYRSFIDEKGDLRAGDATGLEAQWILSMVDCSLDPLRIPEDDYTISECRRSRSGIGCHVCGDETAVTEDGKCASCRGIPGPLFSWPGEREWHDP